MKVYLVEDQYNSPGLIYAIFDNEDDAETFADCFDGEAGVVERTLFRGQPSVLGFNK